MPVRALWLTLGLVSTACGVAGVVLPLVPTTPFLLLAAYAFARSSPHLHNWIMTHPRLGPPIAHWNRHGAISRRAKMAAMAVMTATFMTSVLLGVSDIILIAQATVLGGVATFVLTRPDVPNGE